MTLSAPLAMALSKKEILHPGVKRGRRGKMI
jgi:hypothetical protein